MLVNPNQFDWNGNGRGFVCDLSEQNSFGDYLRERLHGRVILNEAARVPIPICAECPVAQLPPNFDAVINVQTPPDYRAVVVDKHGDVIAKPQLSGGIQTLKFTPAPRAFGRGFGTARANDPAPATSRCICSSWLRLVQTPPSRSMWSWNSWKG